MKLGGFAGVISLTLAIEPPGRIYSHAEPVRILRVWEC